MGVNKETSLNRMNIKINEESNVTQQQNVGFADQNQQWIYSIDNQLDDVHRTADMDDASLANFFSRPIKIATLNWTVGATFGVTINPWQLYFEDSRVINRITNYNLLRSRLCVRAMINGNGFHYGRAMLSYRPLHNRDNFVKWRFGLVPQDIIGASQRMHVWLDPTKSQGGTMCLPYVFYKNTMNIVQEDWRKMGEIDIASVTTLQHANGGTDSVTISIFAWAEDVSLSIPTIAEPGSLTPQGIMDGQDEHEEVSSGPISGPAAVVERVAGTLSEVPRLRPFALATEMAAGAVGKVAKAFGMSRPVDTGPISSYKPTYAGNMANSNMQDTSTKLTYDAKQQLTIDPVACGLGLDDEMSIVSIAKRESYLTQFSWATTAIPETLLWNSYVTPLLFATSGAERHYTPMAWASLPFKHWRGSINYRFQIVASSFHKGRLKIVYEPFLAAGGVTEYNTQYTHIIDLAKERDFTVTINWGQEYSYLDRGQFAAVPFDTAPLSAPRHGYANGIVMVSVVNDLTTPSAELSDVSVLVSVSATDDFEVANPDEVLNNVTFYVPQSASEQTKQYYAYVSTQAIEPLFGDEGLYAEQAGLDNADNDLTLEESAPVQQTIEAEMASKLLVSDNTQKIYFGDPITSIRQLLKRYEHYLPISQNATDGLRDTSTIIGLPDFPAYRGFDLAHGLNFSGPPSFAPYTFSDTTMMNWFTPLYLCRRGGIRYKFMYASPGESVRGIMSVRRTASHDRTASNTVTVSNADGSPSERAVAVKNRALNSHQGVQCTLVEQNPVLEIELPFYANRRFVPARQRNIMLNGDTFNTFHDVIFPNSVSLTAGVNIYVSAGEDFSLAFFQSCPVFYFAGDPAPSPAL